MLCALGAICAFSLLPLFSASALGDSPPIGKRVGEMYPDFLLPDLDGDLRRLSDFRGKKVFLFHFASW